jgi:hypothetical protein
MNPDPERDSTLCRKGFIPRVQILLDLHGALHGFHYIRELGEQATFRRIHDAALVFLDQGGHPLMVDLGGSENSGLILPHEAAILSGASAQDGGELPFHVIRGYWNPLSGGTIGPPSQP